MGWGSRSCGTGRVAGAGALGDDRARTPATLPVPSLLGWVEMGFVGGQYFDGRLRHDQWDGDLRSCGTGRVAGAGALGDDRARTPATLPVPSLLWWVEQGFALVVGGAGLRSCGGCRWASLLWWVEMGALGGRNAGGREGSYGVGRLSPRACPVSRGRAASGGGGPTPDRAGDFATSVNSSTLFDDEPKKGRFPFGNRPF